MSALKCYHLIKSSQSRIAVMVHEAPEGVAFLGVADPAESRAMLKYGPDDLREIARRLEDAANMIESEA